MRTSSLLAMLCSICSILFSVPSFGTPPSRSKEVMLLIDLSASRSPEVLAEDKRLVDQVIAALTYSDRIVVLQVQQQGLSDRPRHWESTMPVAEDESFQTSRERSKLSGAKSGLRLLVNKFFETRDAVKIQHTDLFSTVQVASEMARDSEGRPVTIILLSDMLQSAQGIEMEHRLHMPPPNYIQSQTKAGLLPNLKGACIAVYGADTASKDGAAVRSFWQSYFGATGARLNPQDYRTTPGTSLPSCGS